MSDIVLFCLNPLKLKSTFLILIDMLLSWYISDRLMNTMIHIDSAGKGIVPPLKDTLPQVWLILYGSVVLDKTIFFNYVNAFLLFHFNLPWQKGMALYLNKLESNSPMDDLCQVWLEMAQWFWSKTDIIPSINCCSFVILYSWKRVWPLFKQN